MRDICKNIKDYRLKNNLKQEELAEKIFVTRQTVSNYENGKSRPDIDMLIRIAEVFGIDVNTLIYGDQQEGLKTNLIHSSIELAIMILGGLGLYFFTVWSQAYAKQTFQLQWSLFAGTFLKPIYLFLCGYITVRIIYRFLKSKYCFPMLSLPSKWKTGVCLLILLWALLQLIYPVQLVYFTYKAAGLDVVNESHAVFLGRFGIAFFQNFTMKFWFLYFIYGAIVSALIEKTGNK